MATVGAVTVELLSGDSDPQSEQVDVWTVPGQDGVGAQLLGSNQSAFSYVATLFGSSSDVETRLVNLAAIQGTVITIVDDFSKTRTSCLVTKVKRMGRKLVLREGATEVRAQVAITGVRTA